LPESDGTLEWNSTTLVLIQAHSADEIGLGYTYADSATATLIRGSRQTPGCHVAPADLERHGVADPLVRPGIA